VHSAEWLAPTAGVAVCGYCLHRREEPWTSKAEVLATCCLLADLTHQGLIFTGRLFSDGTWRNIIHMTERIAVPTGFICSWRKRRHPS
jgi:hypothetical protein